MDVCVVAIIIPSGTLNVLKLQLKFYQWGCQDCGLAPIHLQGMASGQILFFLNGATTPGGPGPPNCRGFTITLRIPWQVISPNQRLQPNNTQQLQEADIHIPGRIRTRNPSK